MFTFAAASRIMASFTIAYLRLSGVDKSGPSLGKCPARQTRDKRGDREFPAAGGRPSISSWLLVANVAEGPRFDIVHAFQAGPDSS